MTAAVQSFDLDRSGTCRRAFPKWHRLEPAVQPQGPAGTMQVADRQIQQLAGAGRESGCTLGPAWVLKLDRPLLTLSLDLLGRLGYLSFNAELQLIVSQVPVEQIIELGVRLHLTQLDVSPDLGKVGIFQSTVTVASSETGVRALQELSLNDIASLKVELECLQVRPHRVGHQGLILDDLLHCVDPARYSVLILSAKVLLPCRILLPDMLNHGILD